MSYTNQTCGWWLQTGQSSWMSHCPSPVSSPQPGGKADRRVNNSWKHLRVPDGSTGRCVFLPDRPGPWWHFCELGRWVWFYRTWLFSAPHPTRRYSSGSSAEETDCLVRRPADKGKRTLAWKCLPHQSRTGTPAWRHFLRWPVLSTLQGIKGISAWL